MSWFASGWPELGETAAKGALMYVTALAGLRIGERRTIAQWSAVDFVAAIAMGAIVGRTAVASSQSYAVGAVALLTVLATHRLLVWGRFSSLISRAVDHRVRLLVVDGRPLHRQLQACGLTEEDLSAQLRERGHRTLADIRYVLYESKGGLTAVTAPKESDESLIDTALSNAKKSSPTQLHRPRATP